MNPLNMIVLVICAVLNFYSGFYFHRRSLVLNIFFLTLKFKSLPRIEVKIYGFGIENYSNFAL